jgi:hypothetical protein
MFATQSGLRMHFAQTTLNIELIGLLSVEL